MSNPQRNILVTGAGSGLGRGLCEAFSQAGHHLFISDQILDRAQETLRAIGDRGSAHTLDVTSETNIDAFFSEIGNQRVDVLVNNAGVQHVAKLEDFAQDKWDLLVDVILKGTYLMTRAAIPLMRQQGYGRIVNTGSIHSLVASPFKSAYTAAKHGLLGFSKAIALESADVDITINTICPAYIRTPLVEAQIKDQAKTHNISEDDVVQKIMLQPMPKSAFITPQEVAATIEFLCGDMARNITGQTIVIDGGWTVR